MIAKVISQEGKEAGSIELPEALFNAEVNEHVVYLVIKQLLANQRQGTAKTKRRDEVSGGGKKPWKQKGTGRARSGSNTSPVWARGGKAHGPVPRDYYSVIPKKLRKIALTSALSSRAKDNKVVVINKFTCEPAKTKTIATFLKNCALAGKRNLLIIQNDAFPIHTCGRNIRDLDVRRVGDINVYDIMNNDTIIFSDKNLINQIQEAVKA